MPLGARCVPRLFAEAGSEHTCVEGITRARCVDRPDGRDRHPFHLSPGAVRRPVWTGLDHHAGHDRRQTADGDCYVFGTSELFCFCRIRQEEVHSRRCNAAKQLNRR